MMKRILIVDDEIDPKQTQRPSGAYMWYYIQALRDRGFEVISATGPDEGLHKLANDSRGFELLVLDIMMPPGRIIDARGSNSGTRSGVLLADLILEKAPELPVLILTNVLDRQEHEELGRKSNVRGVFFKPNFTPFKFAQEVENTIGGQDNG